VSERSGAAADLREAGPAKKAEQPAAAGRFVTLRTWLGAGHQRTLLLTAASLAIGFLAWQFLSTFVFNPFLIPPPLVVIRTAIPMVMSGEIFADVYISMVRVLVGFVTGSLVGITMGVLLGRLQLLHDLFDPIIELLRYLSPTAMIPIAVIWFGIGEMSKYLYPPPFPTSSPGCAWRWHPRS
jgi:NitT/TauT family transport system permease protein/taurine transport system permease protein